MNQEYAEMDLLPNDPRTTSRRSISASAGSEASAGIEAGAGAKAGASAGAESGTEARQAPNTGSSGADALFDPLRLNDALWRLGSRFAADPSPLASAWLDLAQSWGELCTYGAARMLGAQTEPVARPDGNDRRFRDSAWNDVPWLDILKQAYLVNSRACTSLPAGVAGLDESSRSRLEFVTRQVTDALAPTNFFPTNPEAVRAAVESGGTSAVNGMRQFLRNLDPETGRLDVPMCPPDAFTVGESIATTPGKVVFQNELIQLIQYAPATPAVRRRPMLLIPPWMNKFYVMDLRPGNSMVEWLVGRGHTVFIISWVNPDSNPDSSLAGKGFDDYMLEGPLAALEAIERATGEREVNAVGYCLGGILLSALSAWLQAKGDTRLASTTYLATMVDFSDVGAVSVFIDEEGLPALESAISAQGYLSGQQVADTWRAVRANDLIWSFYVNSCLLGKEPPALDLLFWNCDPTNMPAAMHTFFMRNMYVENRLREPGGLTLAGEAIDVTRITTPSYVLSAVEDHIAPWKTTYETTQLFAGPVEFVLGASGHIAGVINPPAKHKYRHWTGSETPASPEAWLAAAHEHEGSWWPHWDRWIEPFGGGEVPARIPGSGGLPAIEDAPGSYVMRPMPRD